jgi:hypothetical protein
MKAYFTVKVRNAEKTRDQEAAALLLQRQMRGYLCYKAFAVPKFKFKMMAMLDDIHGLAQQQ